MHTLSVRNDLSACEKFDWLFANVDLNDGAAPEELSRVLRKIYPHVDPPRRLRAIETILDFRPPVDEDEQDELPNARYQLLWLQSLGDADPDCVLIGRAIDGVLVQHPELTAPSDDCSSPDEPWTAEKLLSRSPTDLLDELLSFEQEGLRGPDRHDLLSSVAEAAQTRFGWGTDLGAALTGRELWNADLWISLIRVWREATLTEAQVAEVSTCLGQTGLLRAHAARIADLLLAWLENSDTPFTDTLLARANAIAARLWDLMERDTPPAGCESWHSAATGRTAGILARYWLRQRSILRERPGAVSQTFVAEVRDALSTIAQDPSVAGKQGTAVLAGQVAFLLDAEDRWTRANLLPRFRQHPGTDHYWAIWDGFLTAGHLSPRARPPPEGCLFRCASPRPASVRKRQAPRPIRRPLHRNPRVLRRRSRREMGSGILERRDRQSPSAFRVRDQTPPPTHG